MNSRTKFTKSKVLLAATATAALALTACSSSSGGGGGGSAAAAPTDHVLHLSFLQDPGQPPDPDIYYAGQGLILTNNTYEGLITYKGGTATPTLEPSLATAWTASPDNKTFTFTLRPNVTFHDGTPFTSAAIKASFDRRAAVNQGPAYMVSDIASINSSDPLKAVITLKAPNSAFLSYLGSPYGPKMMSPTALAAHKGTDNAQTYLATHDVGTGPYTLSEAQVGSKYELKAYAKYWGGAPYFTTVELPVIDNTSSQQLQFNSGQLAMILHDLPSSAITSYLSKKQYSSYTQPSMISEYLYVNPGNGFLTDQTKRQALLKAVDIDSIVKQVYFGHGTKATQVYPYNMMTSEFAKQDISYDTSTLKSIASSLPANEKTITIGYDSSQPDNQIVSNLISAQLAPLGITVKVQAYPTSQIFGWIGNAKGAPDLLATLGWPDSPSPYTWAHISFDKTGGLNYFGCDSPEIPAQLATALASGKDADYSTAAATASATGCWLNMVNVTDYMVAQPWLKGVAEAHQVDAPNTLLLKYLSA
ncbi:peptide/nickel transport system substrate-binding protein [Jatrophihabitans sp. GAS493]|uniref:ABC transporter substrate-binding protein n=1 Tax=Jatrophihabitans sp. GAS493 TaxID=1907575 RepID=UPI000BB91B49|nr:ABC transporter substrate-binding protein [Jatrophihabitans sp. GAS493]SOD74235.1 peptide/nickel transport system substrate-binding protein [Jatrophihabitans sp. GAS493]